MRNRAEVGRLVIDILEDEKFTQLMYPDDSDETRGSRINFLVDLYLNMPDKGVGFSERTLDGWCESTGFLSCTEHVIFPLFVDSFVRALCILPASLVTQMLSIYWHPIHVLTNTSKINMERNLEM